MEQVEKKMQQMCFDNFELIQVENVGASNNIALIKLNRPKALNALNSQLMTELSTAVQFIDGDDKYRVIIITGNEKAFAAGADIKEMARLDFSDVFQKSINHFNNWDALSNVKKPVIAAVSGFALGGGTELALMCDIVYASETAIFGQPEVTIGTIPGLGGTQRWPRFASKSVAMEICLTGDRLSADEAKSVGIVSKIFPPESLLPSTIKLAEKIAANSMCIVKSVKESINKSYETSLSQGLESEKMLFQSTFATVDRREGMSAFSEKRAPKWSDK